MKAQIKRHQHSTFYTATDFSLDIPKSKAGFKSKTNLLTFMIGGRVAATVIVPRAEAAYVLKKFRKVLDKSRKIA